MTKGRQTKAAIADAALLLARRVGLEGLSIGAVAEAMRMSKSGVFAHFGSREELQIAVVAAYFTRFEQAVFQPALTEPRGLPRLERMFESWMEQVVALDGAGCLFISGAVDFDDRPGAVRDALVHALDTWLAAIRRAIAQAESAGHLRAGIDEQQLSFEIHALILALHFEARFMQWPDAPQRARRGFEALLSRHRARP